MKAKHINNRKYLKYKSMIVILMIKIIFQQFKIKMLNKMQIYQSEISNKNKLKR